MTSSNADDAATHRSNLGRELAAHGWCTFFWDGPLPWLAKKAVSQTRNDGQPRTEHWTRSQIWLTRGLRSPFIRLVHKIALEAGYRQPKLKQVRLQISTSETSKNELPFLPHIDRDRYLKALVYLNDVELTHGPIQMASAPPSNLEAKRLKFSKDSKQLGENLIPDVATHPILGPSGTVILFDTNTPHCAGSIDAGRTRRILRFDFDQRWLRTSVR